MLSAFDWIPFNTNAIQFNVKPYPSASLNPLNLRIWCMVLKVSLREKSSFWQLSVNLIFFSGGQAQAAYADARGK